MSKSLQEETNQAVQRRWNKNNFTLELQTVRTLSSYIPRTAAFSRTVWRQVQLWRDLLLQRHVRCQQELSPSTPHFGILKLKQPFITILQNKILLKKTDMIFPNLWRQHLRTCNARALKFEPLQILHSLFATLPIEDNGDRTRFTGWQLCSFQKAFIRHTAKWCFSSLSGKRKQ